jgi:hypothetical protein
MALMDAKEYDPRPARKRFMVGLLSLAAIILLLLLWFWPSGRFRYWREWKIGDKFFTAIEHRDFDAAYGIYNADPGWKQHPEKYSNYTLPRFMQDWGAASEFGVITSHKIDCAIGPPPKGFKSPSGIVLQAYVNQRPDMTLLWIEKKSGSLSTSPMSFDELTRDAPVVRAVCYRSQ